MWSYVRKSVPSALVLAVAIAATGATPHPLGAQTAKDQIAFGDRDYPEHKTQRALNSHMKAHALEATNNEALWKAARAREQYEIIAKAPLHDATDPLYKEQAAERLRKL